MLKALEAIVAFVGMIIDFVVLVITEIINVITRLPTYLNFVLSLVNYIPTFIRPFLICACIFISVDLIVGWIRGSQ